MAAYSINTRRMVPGIPSAYRFRHLVVGKIPRLLGVLALLPLTLIVPGGGNRLTRLAARATRAGLESRRGALVLVLLGRWVRGCVD